MGQDEDIDREAHNEHDPGKGPVVERGCRDVLFLLLFIAFWMGMYTLAGFAIQNGDPFRLLLFKDYHGNKCDMADGYDGYKYLYFPSLAQTNVFICVKECPSAVGNQTQLGQYNPFYTYNFLDQCKGKHVCEVGETYDDNRDSYNLPDVNDFDPNNPTDFNVLDYSDFKLENVRCWCPYNTEKFLTICYPKDVELIKDSEMFKEAIDMIEEQAKSILDSVPVIQKTYSDFIRVWWIFPVAGAVAVFMGFVWLLVLRKFSGVIVWVTIFAVCVGLALLTNFLYIQADKAEKDSEDEVIESEEKKKNAKYLRGAAIGVSVIDVILFLILVFMRKRINIAIGVVKEASKAMASMPMIIFFPAVPFLMATVLMIYWIYVTLYLATIKIDESGKTEEEVNKEQNQIQGMQLYHFFGLLWTFNTIIAITQCTIAGAISSWYWKLDKSDTPIAPVISSFYRVFRYHLGSMIFGALIIAIIQFIRAILAYIQKQMKGKENLVTKIAFCLLDCFFACLERFLKFINKNGYIMIAIYGYSFCTAARKAFFLLLSNALRVAAVTMVGDFLIFVGKLAISAATTYVCLMIMQREDNLQYWVVPLVLCAIISYIVASYFLALYEMAVDTILLCFCEDMKRNDGSPAKPYYMTDSLKQYI